MLNIPRPAPFVLISSNHGTMIINRNDFRMVDANRGFGVGYRLMTRSTFDIGEINLALGLINARRAFFGNGVTAIDCGANIGVHTVEWARLMHNWGRVIAFEAQEKIYYALAGNVIINNCLNVTARWAAVGAACGTLDIPEPDYLIPSSFGSLELKKRDNTEFIGQEIDYSGAALRTIDVVTIDSLRLDRLDFMKIDVEGMEADVLNGARESIAKFHPQMFIEVIKSDVGQLRRILTDHGYQFFTVGMNIVAIHRGDPTLQKVKFENGVLTLISDIPLPGTGP